MSNKKLKKPRALFKGATIGIIAPSSSLSVIEKQFFLRGVRFLESFGFNIKTGGFLTFSSISTQKIVQRKSNEINRMFLDPGIDAIMSLIGGYSSIELLELLDYKSIRENPKVLVGFSDITLLNLAILQRAGLITFLGPMLINFCAPKVSSYTSENFMEVTRSRKEGEPLLLQPSKYWACDDWYLNSQALDRCWIVNDGFKIFRHGKTEGQAIGGNLDALLSLAGTSFFPSFKQKILFVEVAQDCDPRLFARYLVQLRLLGVFNQINGLVIGRFCSDTFDDKVISTILTLNLRDSFFPVMYNVDFGHSDPLLTIPLGINCDIDTKKKQIRLLESAVN